MRETKGGDKNIGQRPTRIMETRREREKREATWLLFWRDTDARHTLYCTSASLKLPSTPRERAALLMNDSRPHGQLFEYPLGCRLWQSTEPSL